MNPVRRPHSGSDHDGILAERGRSVIVVRRHLESGAPVPGYLTWGLIPRDADTRPDIQPMNARAETIADKPIFRDAYRERRCVVPIDAFHQKDARGKLHAIKCVDGEPLAIAAPANAAVAPVHDRMPLVLEKQDIDRWLGTEEDPRDLLKPSADDVLQVVAIGKRPRRS